VKRQKVKETDRTHVFEELLSDDTGPGIDRQLHLTDLLVDLFHEMDDEVHQLVLVHLLCVEVGDEETDVIALRTNEGEGER
jgi:hypothetical protein